MTIVTAGLEIPITSAGLTLDEKNHQYIWVNNARDFIQYPEADAFLDLAFNGKFFSSPGSPLMINETIDTFKEINGYPGKMARFCGWAGFLERPTWDVAFAESPGEWVFEVMAAFGKQAELVADQPGLVAPRILSMIINEACYGLSESISSAADIDIAMKLGTNYPEGPIAWGKKIGGEKINELLARLAKQSTRYSPHPMLLKHLA